MKHKLWILPGTSQVPTSVSLSYDLICSPVPHWLSSDPGRDTGASVCGDLSSPLQTAPEAAGLLHWKVWPGWVESGRVPLADGGAHTFVRWWLMSLSLCS